MAGQRLQYMRIFEMNEEMLIYLLGHPSEICVNKKINKWINALGQL